MIILKKFSSERKLSTYLESNKQYEALHMVGVSGTVVLLTDEHKQKEIETVDTYINNYHYEDVDIHYKAYYNEY